MNQLKTTLLLTGLTLIFVAIGKGVGGNDGMMIAFVFAMLMNFGSYWFSDKIVLKMYHAQEVTRAESPDFYAIVEELTRKANLPMPKVYIIPSETPNAFATGRNPQHAAVAATHGILNILTREELAGVMSHELAHVRNRDILISTIAATLAGAISMLANMLKWGAILGGGRGNDREGGNPVAMLAMAIVAPVAAMLIQMAVSRSREYLADATGAKICGNPKALARALDKLQQAATMRPMQGATPATAHMFIVNPLVGGGLANLFSTHPPTEDRIARLMAM